MIRLAHESDLDDLVAIENGSFEDDRFNEKQMYILLNQGKGLFLVFVSNDNKAIGYIYCVVYPKSKYVRVYSIATLFKRCRIGHDLLAEAEARFRELGKMGMTLEVRDNNTNAIKFYEAMGFKLVESIKDYYGPRQHAFKYRKEFYAKR